VDTVGSKETKMTLQNSSYDIWLIPGLLPLGKEFTEETILNIGSSNQEMDNTPLFPTGFFLFPVPDTEKHSSNIGEAGGTMMTARHQTVMKLARGAGSVIIDQVHVRACGQCERYSSHPIFYKGTLSTI
jgi:hypothetical protein